MIHVEFFKGLDSKWYIRIRARNGKVVATGGEAYSRKWNAKRAAHGIANRLGGSEVVEHAR